MKANISVIVPVYKVPKEYLEKCITSLLNQTISEIEIIIVDDGSPDGCGLICDYYSQMDERIKVIHQDNKGLSGARNTGVKNSSGKYITFVDGDDWLESNCLELAYNATLKQEVDMVFWGFVKDYNGKLNVSDYERYLIPNKIYKGDEIIQLRKLLLNYNAQIATAYCKLIKRDLLINNNIYHDEVLRQGAEGLEFNIRLFKYIDSALFIDNCKYHYIYNKESISAKLSDTNINYVLLCFHKIYDEIKDDSELLYWFKNRFSYVIVTSFISGFFHPNNELSYSVRKKQSKIFLNDSLVKLVLRSKNKLNIDKSRKLVLLCIRKRFYFIIYIMAKLRYKKKTK